MRKLELHPKDIWFYLVTSLDSTIVVGGTILGSSLLLLAGSVDQSHLRSWYFGGAAVLSISGKRGKSIFDRTEPMMQIAHEFSVEANKNWLQQTLSPSAELVDATIIDVQQVEQGDLSDFGMKRHAMIVAPSQTGKSTIAKALAKKLGGKVTVVDPHFLRGDWDNLEVIGGGRNFAAIEVFMQLKIEKMQNRYNQRTEGKKSFEQEIIVIDEWPAIQKNCPSAQEFMTTMARESLKVGMPIILLAQDFSVKALGLEGEGSVRDAFDVLFLGKAAIARAKALKDAPILRWLSSQRRPGLLNDVPLAIPDLTLSSLPASSETSQPALMPAGEIEEGSTAARIGEASQEPAEKKEAIGDTPLAAVLEDEELLAEIRRLKDEGLSQTRIIVKLWGLKSAGGRPYRRARQEFRELTGE